MELAAVNSPATAFVAGLITSLHCAGMCGPLACALMPARGDPSDPSTVSTVYHVTRLTGYMVLGAVAGGLGRMPLTWVTGSALRWLPWILVLYFVAMALRWDRFLPKPAILGKFSLRLTAWIRGRSRVQAAAALGFATPLLPCGPLYFLLGWPCSRVPRCRGSSSCWPSASARCRCSGSLSPSPIGSALGSPRSGWPGRASRSPSPSRS
jgi:sulfite exporter TauE/SafE